MLSQTKIVDSITVDSQGTLSVRTVTVIQEDGVDISRSYHRHTLVPGSDLEGQDARVASVANAVWTPEVIQAYQDLLAELT